MTDKKTKEYEPKAYESNQPSILVVDDTPASLQLLTGILTSHGYRVRPASSGRLAMRSVAVELPDLILLDVKMPDIDGYEVCRHLKSDAYSRRVPVIFISVLSETAERIEGFKAGGVDYITKPFEPEEVLARVRTHLQLHELTEHLEQKVRERTSELDIANQQLKKINRAYKVLSDCNQALIRATDETALLRVVCRIINEGCGYKLVWIGFAEHDEAKTVRPMAQAGYEEGYLETVNISWADTELGYGPTGTAIREKKPVINKDVLNNPDFTPWKDEALRRGYASSAALPLLTSNQEAIGALSVYASKPDAFTEEEINLLARLANDLTYGLVSLQARAERKQSEEALRQLNETLEKRVAERTAIAETRAKQLQALAVELVETEERERRHFAELLHEDLQQILAAARFQLQAACQSLPPEQTLANVERLLDESISKSRHLSHQLSPPVLHYSGLVPALQWLVRQMNEHFGLRVTLETRSAHQFDHSPLKVFLFRAVQELLFNVVKHARVKTANVVLSIESSGLVVITVSDQGHGFNPDILNSTTERVGLGLLSLRERVRHIRGNLVIESAPGRGSCFTLTVPLHLAEADEHQSSLEVNNRPETPHFGER